MTKKYIIKNVPQSSLYKIALEGGGEVADGLKGKFTSPDRAHQAIDAFNVNNQQTRKVEKPVSDKAFKD